MAPTPSPLLVSLIQAYLKRHGLKAASKALDKELVTADKGGLSTTEEEIVQKHSLEAILSSPSPAASKSRKQASKKTKAKPSRSRQSPSPSSPCTSDSDADDEDEPAQAKSRTPTQKAAAATVPASKGVKRKAAELSKAEQAANSSKKGHSAPATTQRQPTIKEQQPPKDDDSAIVSSSSGTVVGTTTTTPTPKKKHTGARPTPLAALSASATPGSHISNAYQSYEYADRAYKDLSVTRGKGFTKEKNKKKRGSYRGGPIDISGGKSFKFED
ncbi:hypothetical protein DV735_g568, partial [Chaetothyriales sp. CBS 134920]